MLYLSHRHVPGGFEATEQSGQPRIARLSAQAIRAASAGQIQVTPRRADELLEGRRTPLVVGRGLVPRRPFERGSARWDRTARANGRRPPADGQRLSRPRLHGRLHWTRKRSMPLPNAIGATTIADDNTLSLPDDAVRAL